MCTTSAQVYKTNRRTSVQRAQDRGIHGPRGRGQIVGKCKDLFKAASSTGLRGNSVRSPTLSAVAPHSLPKRPGEKMKGRPGCQTNNESELDSLIGVESYLIARFYSL
jgi:hypothetical protein